MYYGFDIGGSKIALGVFNQERRLQWEKRVATPKSSYEDFLQAVEALVREADERFDQQGSVGIGIPGMPETADGTLYAANVPAASGRQLRADLSARLGRDVRLDNDANCFALSEAWDDEFTQYPLVMGLILGTGVGGGIIANGQLVRGVHFTAGEYSFVNTNAEAWDAPDQNMACQCSTSNLLKWYRARKALPEDAPLDGRSFFAAANAGEPEALEVLRRFCHAVAVQIYNLTVLLDVEKVAIGGGISKQPLLLESLRSAYDGLYASRAGQAYMEGLPRCQIVPCAFSSEANQVGVAAAYFEAMQKKC